jgi:hypothetical protein
VSEQQEKEDDPGKNEAKRPDGAKEAEQVDGSVKSEVGSNEWIGGSTAECLQSYIQHRKRAPVATGPRFVPGYTASLSKT